MRQLNIEISTDEFIGGIETPSSWDSPVHLYNLSLGIIKHPILNDFVTDNSLDIIR